MDPLLRDLAAGVDVHRWPQGRDRRELTQCVEYALSNQNVPIRLSDALELSRQQIFRLNCPTTPRPEDYTNTLARFDVQLRVYVDNVIGPSSYRTTFRCIIEMCPVLLLSMIDGKEMKICKRRRGVGSQVESYSRICKVLWGINGDFGINWVLILYEVGFNGDIRVFGLLVD